MSANQIMKSRSPIILHLASGGMEVIWRSAWAGFLMMALAQRIFPLPAAIGTFSLAAALTFVLRGRGWRWVTIIRVTSCWLPDDDTMHVLCVHVSGISLLSRTWLNAFVQSPKQFHGRTGLAVHLVLGVVVLGERHPIARRPTAYRDVCGRFDLGLGMFFGLLLLKLLD